MTYEALVCCFERIKSIFAQKLRIFCVDFDSIISSHNLWIYIYIHGVFVYLSLAWLTVPSSSIWVRSSIEDDYSLVMLKEGVKCLMSGKFYDDLVF